MRALHLTDHGDSEVLSYNTAETPTLEPDTVRVDVKAAAMNHLDVWTRRGLPGVDLEFPHVPGSDAAGKVTEVGDAVSRFDPGDHVAVSAGVSCGKCEFCRKGDPTLCDQYHLLGEHVDGVHAEEAVVSADNLVRVPDHVDWEVAGSSALVFQTAWRMLMTRGNLSAGERVLVLGASGGVGHAAVQIADYAGAEVYATASSQEKLAHAADCGADHLIDYTSQSFAREIYDRTDGRGVDVVVDHIGTETYPASLKSLAKGGRLLTCGATTGPDPDAGLNRIFWNQLSVIGSTMATPGEVDDVLRLVWDGAFKPYIRATLPMSEAARGHRMIEEREGFGKVVLIPDDEL